MPKIVGLVAILAMYGWALWSVGESLARMVPEAIGRPVWVGLLVVAGNSIVTAICVWVLLR